MIEAFFSRVKEESYKDEELKLILGQQLLFESYTLFDAIKNGLLRHEEPDPYTWDGPGFFYGHVAIEVNDENRPLLRRKFHVPVLNIEISTGKEKDLEEKRIAHVVWQLKT